MLVVEMALFAVFWFSMPVMGSVGWSNLHAWLATSSPQGAVTALIRVFGLVGSGWVLATTLVWVLAGAARLPRLQEKAGRWTLPIVRRLLQPVAGLSMLATVAMSSGMASASLSAAPPPHTITLGPAAHKDGGARPNTAVVLPEAVPVSTNAVGRHIAHPGALDHQPPSPPAGAAAASAPSPGNGFAGLKPGTKVYVVQPGDCLSVIAEQHLGDWRLDLVIDQMNRGRMQPDGRALIDDHWIYPGWVLVMPHNATGVITVGGPAAATSARAPARARPTSTSAPVPGHAAAVPPSSSTVPTTVVRTLPTTVPTTLANRIPLAPRTTAAGTGRARSSGGDRKDGHGALEAGRRGPVVPLAAELAGAGLLAAGLVVLLRKLDAIRAGRRRPGEPVAVRRSGDEARVELAARIGADEAGLAFVDRGLRCFASAVRENSLVVPEVLGAELACDYLAVLFAAVPPPPPVPWVMGADTISWVLDRSVPIGDVSDVVAPFPALVSLGVSDDEAQVRVLVNLEVAGVLAFCGDEQAGTEAVASIAVELATVPWAQECRLYLHGLGQRRGLGVAEPVRVVDDLADCVREFEAVAAVTRAATIDQGGLAGAFSSIGELRLRSDDPTDLGPAVLVCAAPADPELLQRLAALAVDPASGLLAVLTADPGGQRWRLDVDAEGTAEVGPLARRLRLQCLPLPVLDVIETRLGNAAEVGTETVCTLAGDWWDPVAVGAAELDDEYADDDVEPGAPGEELSEAGTVGAGDEAVEPEAIEAEQWGSADRVIELDQDQGGGVGTGVGRVAPLPPALVRLVPGPMPGAGPAPVLSTRSASVVVQVLHGYPRVWRVDGPEPEEMSVPRLRSLEAIVYLALRREQDQASVSSHRLAEALHPEKVKEGRKATDQTFATEMTTARKALGVAADGTALFPTKAETGGKLCLSDKVITDWAVLRELLHRADQDSGLVDSEEERIQVLTDALSLLGDEAPFAEIRRRATDARRRPAGGGESEHWRWVDIEHPDLENDVVDAAYWLAALANTQGRHHEARRAARCGLRVSPLNSELCAELLTAEHAIGGPRAAEKAWEEIERAFRDNAEPYDVVPPGLRHAFNQLARVAQSG